MQVCIEAIIPGGTIYCYLRLTQESHITTVNLLNLPSTGESALAEFILADSQLKKYEHCFPGTDPLPNSFGVSHIAKFSQVSQAPEVKSWKPGDFTYGT
jgi:hypothetical protein